MCSTLDGMYRLNINLSNSSSLNVTRTNEDDLLEWCNALTFLARLVAYISILALIVMVVLMILKYIADFDDERSGDETSATETQPLRPEKARLFRYGTCFQDLESGTCSTSSHNSASSSSEELYDGKVCVICYDEERNCFFVPCGHCATCHDCAQRIFTGENKTCPVCRRFIGKVRKLFAA